MPKLSKFLIVSYIALLAVMIATPVLATVEYENNTLKTGQYCCPNNTTATKLDNCFQDAAKKEKETEATLAAANCAEMTTCQAGTCAGGDATIANLLDIGAPCDGSGNGDECASGACGATSNICTACTLSSNTCFGDESLLPKGAPCNPKESDKCASGYCSPLNQTCGEIIAPTTAPAGSSGGEPIKSIKLPNFLFTEDPNDVIGRVIEFVIGLAGAAALVMFIYGGVRWLTSGGNDEGIKKGREAMQWAAIGLIIVFSSYVLVKFVLQVIGSTAGA